MKRKQIAAILVSVLALNAMTLPAVPTQLLTNLEQGKQQTVVTYGTSLTDKGKWVPDLTEALKTHFPGQATVVNSGGSGQWSQWGLAHLEERVISKNPDTVFIEFSINDAVARFGATVDDVRRNLETMIARILENNPDCEIILMTMTPGNAYPEGHRSYRKDIEAHYEMYRQVARERGFLLIDHYPRWKQLQAETPERFKRYVPDSIHPIPEGWDAMVTPYIFEAIGLKAPEHGNFPSPGR
ncbi:SGNH/GDSL hydrolase family protein [Coraliomargarita parva]|uniref:SGNH/GDSL hydrolase family protein n=1 Tax=Coraliomargarita parva TaxID=3014050 RepID=UPI0022B5B0AA|nr:SGNH/GDSL hydrolase family protein [Coraliomargarita parva]